MVTATLEEAVEQEHIAVIGIHWGDEGKGKIVDILSEEYDVIVRFGGGANSGHTVVPDDAPPFVHHSIPCGMLHGKKNVIGNGCFVNPDRLNTEVEELLQREVPVRVTTDNLYISDRAHVVTPYQLLLDIGEEIAKSRESGQVGTTMQGIGPTAETQAARVGFLRMVELRNDTPSELEDRLKKAAQEVLTRLTAMKITSEDVLAAMDRNGNTKKMTKFFKETYFDMNGFIKHDVVLQRMLQHKEKFSPFVTDVSVMLNEEHRKGSKILYEGAQGTMLDLHQGTFPKVTCTTATIGGAHTGTGTYFPIKRRLGVMKAYTTRVGEGSMPTEDKGEAGQRMQKDGQEFGATTGRPRRCGWLDAVMAKHAVRVNNLNELAVMKLDVLDTHETINVCVSYKIDDKLVDTVPADERELARAKPQFVEMPGWKQDTTGITDFDKLPENAKKYIGFIENFLGVHVSYVSTGPARNQIIVRKEKERTPLTELLAISPIDGRYREDVEELAPFSSEKALIQNRLKVEIEYLIALEGVGITKFTEEERVLLRRSYERLTDEEAQLICDIERKGVPGINKGDKTDHDVKSAELFLKNKFKGTSLEDRLELFHICLTSEDVNNIAYSVMLRDAVYTCLIPALVRLEERLVSMIDKYKDMPMAGRTHGQPATPTTVGKELAVFAQRIAIDINELRNMKLKGKFNGSTGNYSPFYATFPNVNWIEFSKKFVESFGLEHNPLTTQVESHDSMVKMLTTVEHLNTVLIGTDQDMWGYISDKYFEQKREKGEVGSSVMPQKINPIKFENSEGNLGIANAFIDYFARKLPISRFQRDLSDSTVQRWIGTSLSAALLAYKNTNRGLGRCAPYKPKIDQDLNDHWEMLGEPVQNAMRREGIEGAYDLTKDLAQGKQWTEKNYKDFVNQTPLSDAAKKELLAITPHNYIGKAPILAEEGRQFVQQTIDAAKKLYQKGAA